MNPLIPKEAWQMTPEDWDTAGVALIAMHRRAGLDNLNDDEWEVLLNMRDDRGMEYMRSLNDPAVDTFLNTPVCMLDESAYVEGDLMGDDYLNALRR